MMRSLTAVVLAVIVCGLSVASVLAQGTTEAVETPSSESPEAIAPPAAPEAPEGLETPEEPKPEPTKEQAHKDAAEIQALYEKHKAAFEGIYGGVSVAETSLAATLKLCAEHSAKIAGLEKSVLPEIRSVLARVTELWGPQPEVDEEEVADDGEEAAGEGEATQEEEKPDALQQAMNQAGGIEWNMKMAATGGDVSAVRDLPEEFDNIATRYGDLSRMLSSVERTRVANAEYLANDVKNVYGDIDFYVEDIRVDKLTEAKTILVWALKFDATNEYANRRLATIDSEIAALEKQIEAEIDARTWAGDLADFPGPGTTSQLSQAALDFFRNHKNWGKNENGTQILAACVRGGWQPAERDLFGRIVSWRLPIHLAITKPGLMDKNIARVYELSVLAQKAPPYQAQKAPPFANYWVGDSWNMRLDKVPH